MMLSPARRKLFTERAKRVAMEKQHDKVSRIHNMVMDERFIGRLVVDGSSRSPSSNMQVMSSWGSCHVPIEVMLKTSTWPRLET